MSTERTTSADNDAPPAEGVRAQWHELPERVRAEIETRAGSRVVTARSQPGGFSPGLAAILDLANGGSVFVKAVGPELNPDSPGMFRREGIIAAALPIDAPVPRLRWSFEEGEGGWIALAFDVIDGRTPRTPWLAGELDRVIDAINRLSAALTPSPVPAEVAGRLDRTWSIAATDWWRRVGEQYPEVLDDWSRRHLDRLIDLQAGAGQAVEGNTLLHIDLRADNLLITGGGVVVVDWPHAHIGAAWIDPAAMAPSVAMQGGPAPEEFFARHTAARNADPGAVNAFIAALTGYFLHQAALPPPSGIPTVRAFQRAQGEVARAWLTQRTGWR